MKMGQIYSWFLLFIKYKTFIFQLSAPVKKGAIEDSDFVRHYSHKRRQSVCDLQRLW